MLRNQIGLFSKILSKRKLFYSTAVSSNENTKPTTLFQKLSDEFTDVSPVVSVLKYDDVKNINFDEWKSHIYVMKRFHFTTLECFKMISKYPDLLKIPTEKFEGTVEQWFCAELGIKHFQLVLLNHPILFEIDKKDIGIRIPKLRSMFRTSTALALLLINSPNVMYDNWQAVLSKIDYLLKERGFKIGDITLACALSKSLDFIKFRLDLLEKCGIFKQETTPIHKINKYDKSRHKNPQLKDILLTNTQMFSKIANISTEEYAVCRDLFMANETDDDDDDFSDSEE